MNTVPVLSMIFMGITALISFLIPAFLLIYYRRKGADLLPFFIGCFIMLVFALLLEQAVHGFVLGTAYGFSILNNVFLYALYGGIMAALFEEFGRLFAFKVLLRKYMRNDRNALMYGAGHGGLEAIVILGITMINNLTYSFMINNGSINDLLATLGPAQQKQVMDIAVTLASTSPFLFLLGGVERIFAITLHIALSVFVFYAVREKRIQLFLLALLFHFLMDACSVILSTVLPSPLFAEIFVAIVAGTAAYIAYRLYMQYSRTDNS